MDSQQYIFTTDYNPQKTPTGASELNFIETSGIAPCLVDSRNVLIGSDVREFMKVIEELRSAELSRRRMRVLLSCFMSVQSTQVLSRDLDLVMKCQYPTTVEDSSLLVTFLASRKL